MSYIGTAMAKPGGPGPMKLTTILLSDDDLMALRELAAIRARLSGERVSAGATIRGLIRREHERVTKREAARA